MDPIALARQLFFQALDHHNRQRLDAAEALYRQALTLVPDRPSVLVNLAAVLAANKRFVESAALCERALAVEPGNSGAIANLATCRHALGDGAGALELVERALAMQPDDPELHSNRAVILRDLRRLQEALASFDRALALRPTDVVTHANRAQVLAELRQPDAACAGFVRALELRPDDVEAGEGLIGLIKRYGLSAADRDPHLTGHLAQALREPWGRPAATAPIVRDVLAALPEFARCLARCAAAWPRRLPLAELFMGVDAGGMLSHPMLIALMESTPVADLRFERLLASLRAGLVAEAVAGEPGSAGLDFLCSLALQCFINEYVYTPTPQESRDAECLRQEIGAALDAGVAIDPFRLAALATLEPLHALPAASRLLDRQWPAPLSELLRRQVSEPLAEHALRDAIPRLTPIRDAMSSEVRRQYEENPYPRWLRPARAGQAQALPAFFACRVPGVAAVPMPATDAPCVLNAGCGTGQHAIETAQRLAGADVLAVDLSLSSLAYARRQADSMGVRNIRFAQADILELGVLEERFDLIESAGVLHHLRDPAAGLAVLRGLLRPGGVMRLALYSERARHAVVAARELVVAEGIAADVGGIRRLRECIAALPDGAPGKGVADFCDFHSLSECRDLVFHVCEHRFTCGRLAAMLQQARLEFLGFEAESWRFARFRERFPEERAWRDLGCWEAFEADHPDTFAGMYQFWVRPRD